MSRYMWYKCECGKGLKHLILWNGGSTNYTQWLHILHEKKNSGYILFLIEHMLVCLAKILIQ